MLVLLYLDCWNIEGVVATYEYEVILNAKINKWHSCHWCTKSELQLLIGSVNNTVCYWPTFLRGHVKPLSTASALHRLVRLNTSV